MNRTLLILNIVLLAAVVVLFVLVLGRNKRSLESKVSTESTDSLKANTEFRLAYFDMDSVENNFALWKQMQEQVNAQEKSMSGELNALQNNLQSEYEKFQAQGPTMTPQQIDDTRKKLTQMDINLKNKRVEYEQKYQSLFMTKQQEIIGYIKEYCKEFNKDGKYSLIIANEPGLIYYKDTTFNITSELLRGLNEKYKAKKQ